MLESDTKDRKEEEINLLHFVLVILKRKWMIAGITLACALITFIISFFMNPIYRAETRILPPQQSSSSLTAQVLSQIGGVAGLTGSSQFVKSPNDVYIGMLKSRTVYDRVIDRFNLMELYGTKYREEAREKLDSVVNVKSGKDQLISITVVDRDSERAAEMTNAFVEELKVLTQTLAVTEASHRRLFFEEQLERAQNELIKAEEAMRSFQERTGAIKMEEQAKAVIESVAELRAKIAAREVELEVMKTYAKPKNPDFQRADKELSIMKEQLAKLEANSGEDPDPLLPTGRMPKVSTDYARKLRELKYHETLFELMAKQYEIARVDEARDATIIQVLDKALPPEKKAGPQRASMVAVGTFAGFFLAIFVTFLIEYSQRILEDPNNKGILFEIRKHTFFWRTLLP
jgi:tyrosine-protein kinase Etk/Wzc